MSASGRLVDKDGNDVKIGATITTNDDESFTLMGWRRPHKPGSTGRVFVKNDSDNFEQQFFPGVFGLKIIEHEFS